MFETKTLKSPWLIQCCEVKNGKMRYDYMGSAEFEIGDQSKSLKRIFAEGMDFGTASVTVVGKQIPVYMIAIKGFPFAEYQPYLQELADSKRHLKEWTRFDDAVKVKAGVPLSFGREPDTNAWFDFPNNVLWALSQEEQQNVVQILEGIKDKWSKK
jgi:hypothetical protein